MEKPIETIRAEKGLQILNRMVGTVQRYEHRHGIPASRSALLKTKGVNKENLDDLVELAVEKGLIFIIEVIGERDFVLQRFSTKNPNAK